MKEIWIREILDCMRAARELKPLVHMIPNFVTAGFCADGIAALGGRPVMAAAPEEMEEITGSAAALVVNMGQPSGEKLRAAAAALETAAAEKVPALLDPVGAGASEYRRNLAERLTSPNWSGVIKGNQSEIRTLLTGAVFRTGVDSLETGIGRDGELSAAGDYLKALEKEGRSLALAATGNPDQVFFLRSGKLERVCLSHGQERRLILVGTGCLAGAIGGTLLAAARMRDGQMPGRETLAALAAGAAALVACAEETIDTTKYGTYKLLLLDSLGSLSGEQLKDYLERHMEIREA